MSATLMSKAARTGIQALAVACASLALVTGAQAQHMGHGGFGGGVHAGPGFGHGHFEGGRGYRGGRGFGWGGVGLGLGVGLGVGAAYYGWPYYAPAYAYDAPYVVTTPMTDGNDGSGGPPLVYPRNGQAPAQTDADSNACSQWAGAQPNATADARIFQRGFAACMDGRGYSIR
jgi:hypothetical protein